MLLQTLVIRVDVCMLGLQLHMQHGTYRSAVYCVGRIANGRVACVSQSGVVW